MRVKLLKIFIIAVVLNYAWEIAQSPLYSSGKGALSRQSVWWHCLPASIGDGVLVLIIFGIGCLVLKRPNWDERPGRSGYLMMAVAGVLTAASLEWLALRVGEWWSYGPQMPVVPGLGIGVTPLAQMVVLPPLAFRLAAGKPHLQKKI